VLDSGRGQAKNRGMPTVRYLVEDVETAIPFFELLGFSVKQHMGTAFASMEREGLELWVAGPASSARRPMPDGTLPAPGGWNRFVVEVEDIAAVVARLKQAGVRFRNEPLTGPGGTQVLVEDPSGNPVELFQAAAR
jgi:catechol 2,3-dioxygenase-like lactoylglutathione lyase family enzyme